ncbi:MULTISPECIES: hypothetical protein [Vibrio]|uniref:hypothetical protein n=1 Tax=Vibrio TaxID=662 RepID=UPI00215D33B3|nr:hypothetical protein [Vibrio sp. RM-69-4]MCR9421160.1 hypothetical protein [Vibrio sp. RM-69-4]
MNNFNKSLLILSWLVTLVVISLLYYQSVYYFNRTPWDGTFQTLFPLLKMDNGLYPGRDYFYFHGNGIPYIIYPLYYIFNSVFNMSTMMSALTSTFIINTVFLIFPLYLLLRKAFDKQVSSVLTVFFLALSNYIPYIGGYLSPFFLGAPMGVRFSPHLIMALVVYQFISKEPIYKCYLYFGIVGSLCVLLAAEQGFYAVGGALITIFMYELFKSFKGAAAKSIVCFASFIFCFIASNYMAFGSLATISAIQSISNDQSWVFGVYPNRFYDTLSEVFSFNIIDGVPSQVTAIVSLGVTFVTFLLVITKKIDNSHVVFLTSLLVLFFGSLLSWASNVGYIGAHQAALNVRYIYILIGFFAVLICTDWKSSK